MRILYGCTVNVAIVSRPISSLYGEQPSYGLAVDFIQTTIHKSKNKNFTKISRYLPPVLGARKNAVSTVDFIAFPQDFNAPVSSIAVGLLGETQRRNTDLFLVSRRLCLLTRHGHVGVCVVRSFVYDVCCLGRVPLKVLTVRLDVLIPFYLCLAYNLHTICLHAFICSKSRFGKGVKGSY